MLTVRVKITKQIKCINKPLTGCVYESIKVVPCEESSSLVIFNHADSVHMC